MQVKDGGSRGSASEASVTQAWPKLEADYLKSRLVTGRGKWDTRGLDPSAKVAYLQEVAQNHKTEADECLKRDFKLWLEGAHPTYNNPARPYEGDAKRIHVYNNGNDDVGKHMTAWRSTPWGTDQLTHLPGVRNFLRDEFERGKNEEMRMNLLAEHGPQDLEQAWQYFKHWVAERPLDEAQCAGLSLGPGDNKAMIGQPGAWHMRYRTTPDQEPVILTRSTAASAATAATTAAATAAVTPVAGIAGGIAAGVAAAAATAPVVSELTVPASVSSRLESQLRNPSVTPSEVGTENTDGFYSADEDFREG